MNTSIENYEVMNVYKISSAEYISKHSPSRVAGNMLGTWYEHPLYGDEAGLLLDHQGRMYLTYECEVPTDEELGFPAVNPKSFKVIVRN